MYDVEYLQRGFNSSQELAQNPNEEVEKCKWFRGGVHASLLLAAYCICHLPTMPETSRSFCSGDVSTTNQGGREIRIILSVLHTSITDVPYIESYSNTKNAQ